jgi:uncharacterized protein (DUF1697 family)
MPRLVALLRGVNVGGRNRLPMAELRALAEGLGLREVETFIQSGNLLFSSDLTDPAGTLALAIERRFGLAVPVVVRSAEELERVRSFDPFPQADANALHVGFLAAAPGAGVTDSLEPERFISERFVLAGCEVYFWLPAGMGRAKLPAYLDRRLPGGLTVRNWRTLEALARLAAD